MSESKELIISARAIIECGPEVLLLRRAPTGELAGSWEFPGGSMEPEDENNICATALRETRQETGQELDFPDLNPVRLLKEDRVIPDGKHKGRPYRAFGVILGTRTKEVTLNPDEHVDYEWLLPTEVRRMDHLAKTSRQALVMLGPLLLDSVNILVDRS